jgi:hypothetical protein
MSCGLRGGLFYLRTELIADHQQFQQLTRSHLDVHRKPPIKRRDGRLLGTLEAGAVLVSAIRGSSILHSSRTPSIQVHLFIIFVTFGQISGCFTNPRGFPGHPALFPSFTTWVPWFLTALKAERTLARVQGWKDLGCEENLIRIVDIPDVPLRIPGSRALTSCLAGLDLPGVRIPLSPQIQATVWHHGNRVSEAPVNGQPDTVWS